MAEPPSGPQSYSSIPGARLSHSIPLSPSTFVPQATSRLYESDLSSPYRVGHVGYVAAPSVHVLNQQAQQAAAAAHYQASMPPRETSFSSTYRPRENSLSSVTQTPGLNSFAVDWPQQPLLSGKMLPMQIAPISFTELPITPSLSGMPCPAPVSFTPAIVGVRHPMTQFRFGADFPFSTDAYPDGPERRCSSHSCSAREPKSPGGLSASTVVVGVCDCALAADVEDGGVEDPALGASCTPDGNNFQDPTLTNDTSTSPMDFHRERSQSVDDRTTSPQGLPSLTEWPEPISPLPKSIICGFADAEKCAESAAHRASGDFQSTEAPSSDITSQQYLARHALTSSIPDSFRQFTSTSSCPHSVVSEAFLPAQSAPWCPLSPTAEDVPCFPEDHAPSTTQSQSPEAFDVAPAVLPIGYKGHHARNESFPCMNHHAASSPQHADLADSPDTDDTRLLFTLGESRPSRRLTHQRNTSTSSCPQTESRAERRQSAPQAVHKPAWLVAECEKGFRFVAQNTDDMITVSQNKTALTFVFEQLGPDVVPMPKYDTWFAQVFQNFDEEGSRVIHFDNFVEIVLQYYEHHTKYRRRRAHHQQQQLRQGSAERGITQVDPTARAEPHDAPGEITHAEGRSDVKDAEDCIKQDGGDAEDCIKEDVENAEDCIKEDAEGGDLKPDAEDGNPKQDAEDGNLKQDAQDGNLKQDIDPQDIDPVEVDCVKVGDSCIRDTREGDVGSEADECVVSGPPIFPESKCLLPEKGRATSRSSLNASVARLESEKGTPVKLPARLEYPAYAGRLQIFDDYEFQNQAGKGAFGKVIVVKNKRSKAIRACKTIRVQNDLHKTLIDNEIECLQQLNHPNILKLYETYSEGAAEDDNEFYSRNIYLIMELCEGGDLMNRMLSMYSCAVPAAQRKKLTENVIARMVQQMLSGIAYCHTQGIIHRDLKPDNILFVDKTEDSDLKIIDFGLASFKSKIMADAKEVKVKRPGMLGKLARALPGKSGKHIISHHVRKQVMQRAGTAHYMAPEMFRAEYDEKCDLFSIGIILYQLLTGTHPFYENRDDEEKVRHKILSDNPVEFPKAAWSAISKEAKDMTYKLLIKNPLKRPSAAEVINSHKWLKDYSTTMHFGKLEDISSSVFEGLNRYQGHNTLKKAVLQLLARELSEFQIQELRKKFLALDKSGTGTITREELKQGMKQSGKILSEKEVRNIMSALSEGSNGELIGYNQFVGALIERVSLTRSQLEQVFQKLDTDKSGCITPAKLQSALTSQNITLAEVQEIWREVDPSKNPSAGISFDEFCSLFNFPNSQPSPKMAKI